MNNKKYSHYTANHPVEVLIDQIQECFPIAFPVKPHPKVALKVGILDDLFAWGATNGTSKSMIKRAMRAWCQGLRYAKALSIIGAPRYDLQGNVCGGVDANHARGAKGILNKIIQAKVRRRLSAKQLLPAA